MFWYKMAYGKSRTENGVRGQNSMKKEKINAFSLIVLVVLILYSCSLLVLIGWGLLASVKDPILDFRINIWGMPKKWQFSNYAYVFQKFVVRINASTEVTMLGQIFNTLLICTMAAFCGVFFPCLIGYLVAKYKCKFSQILYSTALIVMALPIVGSQPSELALLKKLNLYDNYLLVFFHKSTYFGLYFFVFVATFSAISNDFYEAASLDGASDSRIYFTIMLPMVLPTCLAVFLILFVQYWNDYQYALMYLPSMPTLAYGLHVLSTSLDAKLNNVPMRMAGCGILMLPILTVYIIFKDKLMGNFSMGGLKE